MKKDRTPHPDQQYITALAENNPILIRKIYDKCVPMVRQLIAKNNGTTKDADDIFQEAMIDTLKKANTLKLYCPIEGYLYRVCRNLWLNALKKKGRRGVTFSDLEQYTEEGAEQFEIGETSLDQQKWDLFNRFLLKLSERCQEFLRLSWKGHSMKEVATKLGVTYNFARKKKSECQGKLVKMVQASGDYKRLMRDI